MRRALLLAGLAAGLALVVAAPALAAVSGTRAKAFVARVAALGPRPAGSANERAAGRMVAARLQALGYRVLVQRVPLPRDGASRDVVGLSPGNPRVVVVAHLDGVRAGPAANDNGSGLATMLEVAAALAGRKHVLVAAVGAEERVETGSPIHLGSTRLMRTLSPLQRRRVRLALSLDMVGVGKHLYVRGVERLPNRSARITLAHARGAHVLAAYLRDSGQSDHAEMTRAGLQAAWLEWREDACWHSPCDRASRVRAGRLAAAARVALAAARSVL
jgi:hypothetical protein